MSTCLVKVEMASTFGLWEEAEGFEWRWAWKASWRRGGLAVLPAEGRGPPTGSQEVVSLTLGDPGFPEASRHLVWGIGGEK